MKRIALAALLLAMTGTVSAQLTLFENDNFQGSRYDVRGAIENLGNTGFNDKASSVRIRAGNWQLCDDAYFRGRCVTLKPGDYPSLGRMGMNDKVSSARELGSYGPQPAQGGNWGGGARAVLYSQPGFGGQQLRRRFRRGAAISDNTGFNDRASSLRVEQGYWMFCSDANFEGQCHDLRPRAITPTCPASSTTASRRDAACRTTTRTGRTRTGAATTEAGPQQGKAEARHDQQKTCGRRAAAPVRGAPRKARRRLYN